MFHTMQPIKQDIPADGDPIALAIVLGLLAIFAIWVLVSKKRKKNDASPVVEVEQAAAAIQEAPGTAGQLKLHDVEPKTAAMLMAIVADKMGTPLNELRFISIKEVKE